MTVVTGKETSLFRATFSTIKHTSREWWIWVLCFAVLMAGLNGIFEQLPMMKSDLVVQYKSNPHLFQDHPEMVVQFFQLLWSNAGYLTLYLVVLTCLYMAIFYTMSVICLNHQLPQPRLHTNVSDFMYWSGKVSWKYTRPILWLLLPLIGGLFYMRSIVRYTIVTPLSLLRQGDELKTSWAMTKNNWWRIFLNQFGVAICGMVLFWLIVIIPIAVAAIAAQVSHAPAVFAVVYGILWNAAMCFGCLISAAYTSVVYRVLTQEQSLPA